MHKQISDSSINDVTLYSTSSENFIANKYKRTPGFKSTSQLFIDKTPKHNELPNYSQLYEKIEKLKSDASSEEIIDSLKYIEKKFQTKQNDQLLDIFEETNIFFTVTNYFYSEDSDVSIEVLKFIMEFTSLNEDFAQLFIECNLFGLLLNIVNKYYPSDWDNNETFEYQYFNTALSIFVNLSQFNQVYIKKLWKTFTPKLFFKIIDQGNAESLIKCAKIANCSICGCDIKSICDISIKGLVSLLYHQNDLKVIEISLFAILKYFDDNKKSIFDPKLLQCLNIQKILESFYLSNQDIEIIKKYSLVITGYLLYNDVIDNFYSESLFSLLQDNSHPEIQGNAFWCLRNAILKDKICDKQVFLDFLKKNLFEILLETTFKTLYFGARAVIAFLKKLTLDEFLASMNDVMVLALIKFLQFEDYDIQKRTIGLFLRFKLDDVINAFMEADIVEALEDILNSDCNDDLKVDVICLSQRYDLGV